LSLIQNSLKQRNTLSDIVIKTIGLTRQYKSSNGSFFNAVDHVDLEVYKGEVFAFLGPNGAGKTTTMKMLLGLTYPSSGSFTILDGNIKDRKIRYRIGYLPEESTIYPFLKVEDVIRFYTRLFGGTSQWRKERVDKVIEFTNLSEKRHEQMKNLSKGLRQRVGIAQSLINDPELIFFDEPASGLDPIGIQDLRDLMFRLKEWGKTIFLNSHQLSEVELVADRVGMLRNGKLLKVGEIKKLLGIKSGVEIAMSNITSDKVVNVISGKFDLPKDSWKVSTDEDGVLLDFDNIDLTDEIISLLISSGARIDAVKKLTKNLETLFSEVMKE
jgi:ABC-2 type transport system ATP-binding protein